MTQNLNDLFIVSDRIFKQNAITKIFCRTQAQLQMNRMYLAAFK